MWFCLNLSVVYLLSVYCTIHWFYYRPTNIVSSFSPSGHTLKLPSTFPPPQPLSSQQFLILWAQRLYNISCIPCLLYLLFSVPFYVLWNPCSVLVSTLSTTLHSLFCPSLSRHLCSLLLLSTLCERSLSSFPLLICLSLSPSLLSSPLPSVYSLWWLHWISSVGYHTVCLLSSPFIFLSLLFFSCWG